MLPGSGKGAGCRGVSSPRPRVTRGKLGSRECPFEGAATQPTPPSPAVPTHCPSPQSRAAARGSTSPERSPHCPFSTKQRYAPPLRPRPSARTRRDPVLRTARPAAPAPAADGRRAPFARGWEERWSPGTAAQLGPAPPPFPKPPEVTGGARTARAGRPALTASAPGRSDARVGGRGRRGGTHRNVHSQRTPLLAAVLLAAAPAGAGNILLLLGVHGRASHNFNQKLIPGDSFLEFGPLLPSPAPAVGREPHALFTVLAP